MVTAPRTWMDKAFYKDVQDQTGSQLPSQPVVQFLGNVSCVDDPTNGRTVVTVGTAGGQAPVVLVNGLNSDIATAGLQTVRTTGPTSLYLIGGLALPGGAQPAPGQVVELIDLSGQLGVAVNEDLASTAKFRIVTDSGSNVKASRPNATWRFVYDGTLSRWRLKDIGVIRVKKYDVTDYGAKCDLVVLADGAMSSSSNQTHLSSASAPFTSTAVDAGKNIVVLGAGSAGAPLATTIVSVLSPTVAVVASPALTTVSGASFAFATDDGPAINKAIASAAFAIGTTFRGLREVFIPDACGLATTLNLGEHGAFFVEGLVITGSGRSMGTRSPTLCWVGAVGGTMAQVQDAYGGRVERVGFDGFNTAAYDLWFNPPLGLDTASAIEHWTLQECSFTNARTYNVLIGVDDATLATCSGLQNSDVSIAKFESCMFIRSYIGAQTTAHVAHRVEFGLGNQFKGCQFDGTGSYPKYAITNTSGRLALFGCIDVGCGDGSSGATILLDSPPSYTLTDGAMSSSSSPTLLNSASAPFTSTAVDAGKLVQVFGAGSAGGVLFATIVSVNSTTQAVLSSPALTTVSGATVYYGANMSPGGVGVFDHESQSSQFLDIENESLVASGSCPIYLANVRHSDIVNTGTFSVRWRRGPQATNLDFTSLVIVGGFLDRGINLPDAVANTSPVFLQGTQFYSGRAGGNIPSGQTGSGAVQGSWVVDGVVTTPAGGGSASAIVVGASSYAASFYQKNVSSQATGFYVTSGAKGTSVRDLQGDHCTNRGVQAYDDLNLDGFVGTFAPGEALAVLDFVSGTSHCRAGRITSAVVGGVGILATGGTLDVEDCNVAMTGTGSPSGVNVVSGATVNVSRTRVTGGTYYGLFIAAGGTAHVGPGCDFGSATYAITNSGTLTIEQSGGVAIATTSRQLTAAEHYCTGLEMGSGASGDITVTVLDALGWTADCDNFSAHNLVVQTTTGGTTVTIAAGKSARVRVGSDGKIYRVTADN